MNGHGGLQEFKRNLKREYAKLLLVVQAYALISTGVRLICSNQVQPSPSPLPAAATAPVRLARQQRKHCVGGQVLSLFRGNLWIQKHAVSWAPSQAGSGGRSTVIATQGSASLRDNIVSVLSSRAVDAMEPFQASLADSITASGCARSRTSTPEQCDIPI